MEILWLATPFRSSYRQYAEKEKTGCPNFVNSKKGVARQSYSQEKPGGKNSLVATVKL